MLFAYSTGLILSLSLILAIRSQNVFVLRQGILRQHVYLDTMVLIGTISLKFNGVNRLAFATGAITASFAFFPALGYGGYLISNIMRRPQAWRVLNGVIALIMFALAVKILRAGRWY